VWGGSAPGDLGRFSTSPLPGQGLSARMTATSKKNRVSEVTVRFECGGSSGEKKYRWTELSRKEAAR